MPQPPGPSNQQRGMQGQPNSNPPYINPQIQPYSNPPSQFGNNQPSYGNNPPYQGSNNPPSNPYSNSNNQYATSNNPYLTSSNAYPGPNNNQYQGAQNNSYSNTSNPYQPFRNQYQAQNNPQNPGSYNPVDGRMNSYASNGYGENIGSRYGYNDDIILVPKREYVGLKRMLTPTPQGRTNDFSDGNRSNQRSSMMQPFSQYANFNSNSLPSNQAMISGNSANPSSYLGSYTQPFIVSATNSSFPCKLI